MKKNTKINVNKVNINIKTFILVSFLFIIFSLALSYRCLVDYKAKGELTIGEFIKNRNIVEKTILPERGNIYDTKGELLAQDIFSYTLTAYLDDGISDENNIRHVVDKENTAVVLSQELDLSYDFVMERLNKDAKQVEFGTGGKNISQTKMEEIMNYNLPGINFTKNIKRYYPNGDFASYLLGYTKNKEIDGNTIMVGELGIEGYFNKELTGKNGYIKYERDGRGNRISNSNEYKEEAINGNNIYLTIDSSIQLFVENEVKKASENSQGEWVIMGVMNAKTGEILGYSSTPSFDPNIRNLTNYMDPLVSYVYEPGSTMKTFSYMCAIDSGKYKGKDTFQSGSKTYVSQLNENDTVTIKDWNGIGWGEISYDYGFAMSSNIGVANLLENTITKKELKKCYEDYGFGKKTGILLNNEVAGNISFNYDVEAATAGYGQGITISPIQMLQAMSIISNDGVMIRPYIISKIEDENDNIIKEYGREEIKQVTNKETIDKIKELLRSVITPNSELGTGYAYYQEGYDLIGKTGTASIFENGKYLVGNSDYIYSFSGLYPGDDPEIIIYMAIKKPKDTVNYIAPSIKEMIINLSKYLNINSSKELDKYKIEDYTNNSTIDIVKELEKNKLKTITIGDGNKIIDQYPNKGIELLEGDLVILKTNKKNNKMINLIGMSYKEVKILLELMNVEYELKGYGYVTNQNILENEIIDKKIEIELEGKW